MGMPGTQMVVSFGKARSHLVHCSSSLSEIAQQQGKFLSDSSYRYRSSLRPSSGVFYGYPAQTKTNYVTVMNGKKQQLPIYSISADVSPLSTV